MNDIAIKVENLSKRYRIGLREERQNTFAGALGNWVRKPMSNFRRLRQLSRFADEDADDILWALRDVSFEVRRGEVIGVIGRNGAGKSTLLKILSRITYPTSGRVELSGRVSSLLEVGTGFHPELTGKENIYLNGTILGMTRREIDSKFDEIVDFSGVEKFIDTPVKRYSSGMRVRLAFSVAAHLEPEILLIDEVLAVGDAEFQKKCLGKMGEVAGQGRTVLFVSHNLIALQSLCPRSIWLENGGLQLDGKSTDLVDKYLHRNKDKSHVREWEDIGSAPGNDSVKIRRIGIGTDKEDESPPFARESPIKISVEYWNLDPTDQIHIVLQIVVDQQIKAFSSASTQDPGWINSSNIQGLIRSTCQIPPNLLNTGQHNINLLIVKNRKIVVYSIEDALSFDVTETSPRTGAWFGKSAGVVKPNLDWENEILQSFES